VHLEGAALVYASIALGALLGVATARLSGEAAGRLWGAALEALVYPLVAVAGLAAGSALAGVEATSRLAAALAYYALAPTLASALLAKLALATLERGMRAG